MKVLFVVNYFYGEASGAVSVARTHYQVLNQAFGRENVYTIALVGTAENCKAVEEGFFEIENVSKCFGKRVLNFLQGNTGKIDKRIINKIEECIKEYNIEMVFFDDSIYGNAIRRLKKQCPSAIFMAYYHDVKRNLCLEWIKKQPHKALVYYSLMRNEFLTQKYADYNLILNKREERVYLKYYKKAPEVIFPVVLPTPPCKESDGCVEDNMMHILFVGGYYYPNVNGLDWFVKNVFVKLSEYYDLQIVGNDMNLLCDKYKEYQRIHVTGRVEDLSPYYEAADVVIGPIFEGAGMKVKTAEAFSYGKSFLGTDESLEGYRETLDNRIADKYVFVCNTEKEFCEKLEFVKNNTDINKFNKPVREFFETHYSIDSMAVLLKTVIKNR